MILLEDPEKYAEYQEVDAYSLTDMTQRGWAVIALLNTQTIDSHSSNKPQYDRDGHNIGSNYVDEAFIISQPRYLLGKTRDKVLEELREERRGLKDTSDHHESRAKSLLSKVESLEKDIVAKDKLADEFTITRKKGVEKHRETSELCHRMENDLAKVREAVGNIKFKEIIGSKTE